MRQTRFRGNLVALLNRRYSTVLNVHPAGVFLCRPSTYPYLFSYYQDRRKLTYIIPNRSTNCVLEYRTIYIVRTKSRILNTMQEQLSYSCMIRSSYVIKSVFIHVHLDLIARILIQVIWRTGHKSMAFILSMFKVEAVSRQPKAFSLFTWRICLAFSKRPVCRPFNVKGQRTKKLRALVRCDGGITADL